VQPIFFIAIIGAAIAMSVGYLGNDISLNSQSFGVGEDTLQNPVESAVLTIFIEKTYGVSTADYKDLITECSFRSTTVVLAPNTRLICKLLDAVDGNVIAEGDKIVLTSIPINTPVTIPIDNFAFENANNANNVHDIFIIVQGPPS
jgi:hypothetical protein